MEVRATRAMDAAVRHILAELASGAENVVVAGAQGRRRSRIGPRRAGNDELAHGGALDSISIGSAVSSSRRSRTSAYPVHLGG